MTKILYVLRGLPGAGKSFVADSLAVDGEFPVFSADMFLVDENGEYMYDSGETEFDRNFFGYCLRNAHRTCYSKTKEAMESGIEKVFVANTFVKEKDLTEYQELAKTYGYVFVSMIIENYHGSKNVHNCKEETVEKMRRRFTFKL